MTRETLRVPEIAAELRIARGKVLRWIEHGELRAFNVCASSSRLRPRWVVYRTDLDEFLRTKMNHAPDPPVVRRRSLDVPRYV